MPSNNIYGTVVGRIVFLSLPIIKELVKRKYETERHIAAKCGVVYM